MKSFSPEGPDPARWTARTASAPNEGMAGAAWRRARAATEPTDEDVLRLGARIAEATMRSGMRPWQWRLALAAVLLLSTGGVVGAAGLLLRRVRPAPRTAPAPAPVLVGLQDDHAVRSRHTNGVTTAVPPVAEEVAAAPTPQAALPVRPTAPAPAPTSPAAFAATPRTAPRTVPVTEARVLADAFRSLRADQDAAAALRSLDHYDRAFPNGALAAEARVARAEALIALDRRPEALAALAAFDGAQAEATRNVLVMRGELFAEEDQCPRAVPDFDRVLRAGARGEADARALFGRGACRLRGGDVAAGRADLRRYLDLYPRGAFAREVHEALDHSP